jgi:hypothetical protein
MLSIRFYLGLKLRMTRLYVLSPIRLHSLVLYSVQWCWDHTGRCLKLSEFLEMLDMWWDSLNGGSVRFVARPQPTHYTRTRNKRRHNIRDAGGVRDYGPVV